MVFKVVCGYSSPTLRALYLRWTGLSIVKSHYGTEYRKEKTWTAKLSNL